MLLFVGLFYRLAAGVFVGEIPGEAALQGIMKHRGNLVNPLLLKRLHVFRRFGGTAQHIKQPLEVR